MGAGKRTSRSLAELVVARLDRLELLVQRVACLQSGLAPGVWPCSAPSSPLRADAPDFVPYVDELSAASSSGPGLDRIFGQMSESSPLPSNPVDFEHGLDQVPIQLNERIPQAGISADFKAGFDQVPCQADECSDEGDTYCSKCGSLVDCSPVPSVNPVLSAMPNFFYSDDMDPLCERCYNQRGDSSVPPSDAPAPRSASSSSSSPPTPSAPTSGPELAEAYAALHRATASALRVRLILRNSGGDDAPHNLWIERALAVKSEGHDSIVIGMTAKLNEINEAALASLEAASHPS